MHYKEDFKIKETLRDSLEKVSFQCKPNYFISVGSSDGKVYLRFYRGKGHLKEEGNYSVVQTSKFCFDINSIG